MNPTAEASPERPRIAALIPAYNEHKNLAGVLEPLRLSDLLDEIIVVDDGSDDDTVAIATSFAEKDARFKVIVHERNRGKGAAVFSGWATTQAPLLLLLDADLHNLTPAHIAALLKPVIDGRADMTMGLFWGGHLHTDLSHWFAPFLTGQRGLRAEILEHINHAAAAGYGFEVALTIAANRLHYRRKIVVLRGMWHPPSEFHRGGWEGLGWRFRMYGQIARGWVIAVRQHYSRVKAIFSVLK